MATFTAISLDRLIEPGASKSMATVRNVPDMGPTPPTKLEKVKTDLKIDSSDKTIDKKNHWTQFSPALYATPKTTPISDSSSPSSPSSSFPPSPYVINHKRRGPRLLKSFSVDNVGSSERENAKDIEKKVVTVSVDDSLIYTNTIDPIKANISSDKLKSVTFNVQQINEVEDFLDPLDSVSVMSNSESETNGGIERSGNLITPMSEFYDAWEELSSEFGPQLPVPDIETEIREIRLSWLMEIEKRKQAEEALNNTQTQWKRICKELSSVGLTLPENLVSITENEEQLNDLCQQLYVTRVVSNSVGKAIAKAEVEMEMEAQLEAKNFEITRLWDRLHYYEAVNREMSQRNQEAVDMARRLRQERKRKQKWIWGSIVSAITLGSTVLAWSYLSTGKQSSSSNESHTSE